jgi:N-acetylglutamate synthase
MDRTLLRQIEDAGVNAWPALETRPLDGWLWRYSDGGSQRANSVSALEFTGPGVEAAIDTAEAWYGARGKPSMFQVSCVASPADLDHRLAVRGYRINDPCITLAKEIDAVGSRPDGIEYFATVTPEWFDCYSSVITPERKRMAPLILARIPPVAAFCGLRRDGRIVATALAVPLGRVVIAECVATLATARGTGAASAVMRGLEVWGAARNCKVAALQALENNAPAQALYKSLGYRENGRYHLRVKG